MQRLLLLPLLLGACGLDDFSWGGPKASCSVEWEMRFVDFGHLDELRPEVRNVTHIEGEQIAWTAAWPFGDQMLRARFRIFGPRLDVEPIDGEELEPIVASSDCVQEEVPSAVRERPRSIYTCRRLSFSEPNLPGGDGTYRHEPGERMPEGELVFQEIDVCPQG